MAAAEMAKEALAGDSTSTSIDGGSKLEGEQYEEKKDEEEKK